jgi:hypothetical protein
MLAAVKAVQATASQLNSLRLTVSSFFAAAGRAGAAGPGAAATGAALCFSFGVMLNICKVDFANLHKLLAARKITYGHPTTVLFYFKS